MLKFSCADHSPSTIVRSTPHESHYVQVSNAASQSTPTSRIVLQEGKDKMTRWEIFINPISKYHNFWGACSAYEIIKLQFSTSGKCGKCLLQLRKKLCYPRCTNSLMKIHCNFFNVMK